MSRHGERISEMVSGSITEGISWRSDSHVLDYPRLQYHVRISVLFALKLFGSRLSYVVGGLTLGMRLSSISRTSVKTLRVELALFSRGGFANITIPSANSWVGILPSAARA